METTNEELSPEELDSDPNEKTSQFYSIALRAAEETINTLLKLKVQENISLKFPEASGHVFLDEKETAKYINLSIETLRRGRLDGKRDGHIETPRHTKIGRLVRYHVCDIEVWINQQLNRNFAGISADDENTSRSEENA